MGSLPGQAKGEMYGVEWVIRRTWLNGLPREIQNILDALGEDVFREIWRRAESLDGRGGRMPAMDCFRVAILEQFAWGQRLMRVQDV